MVDSDVPAIADIVRTTWEMDTYGVEIAYPASEFYVRASLAGSAFSYSAVVDGHTVGCVIGAVGKIPSGMVRDRRWNPAAVESLKGTEGYERFASDMDVIETTDDELLEKCGVTFDSQLVLLIISEEMRGMGIGGKLCMKAIEEFRNRGCSSVLIFTDDDCGYGYYDHLGATRLATKAVRLANEDLLMMAYQYIVK